MLHFFDFGSFVCFEKVESPTLNQFPPFLPVNGTQLTLFRPNWATPKDNTICIWQTASPQQKNFQCQSIFASFG